MSRGRIRRRTMFGAAAGVALAVIAGFMLGGGEPDERPASRAVLDRIADRNRDAAAEGAARLAADSEAAARAVDVKRDANEADAELAGRRSANRP